MRNLVFIFLTLILGFGLAACGNSNNFDATTACSDGLDNDNDSLVDFPFDPGCTSAADDDESDAASAPACSDGIDNDSDGLIDHPNDPGCDSAADTNETDPVSQPACSDGTDNDNDGKTDFPNDPGCINAADNDETDPPAKPACSDGIDNDNDSLIDHPADPGCTSAADNDETDPVVTTPACSDGIDNDMDGKIDFPADPGCVNANDTDEADAISAASLTRYELNNQCWAIRANGNGNFIIRTPAGYVATGTSKTTAEPFYLKPSALGKYLLYNRNRQLLSANGSGVQNIASADATDASEWVMLGVGDMTDYPPTPVYNQEPTPEEVTTYRSFVDPNTKYTSFTLTSATGNNNLAINDNGQVITVAKNSLPAVESFSFEPVSGCSEYPEARSNFTGTPFKGTLADGSVLGHADVHVHISSDEFLGGAMWGNAYHKFGIEHALGNCEVEHGQMGSRDFLGNIYTEDTDGHATDGFPTFSEWPERHNLTHKAIYWKWLERAWAGGERLIVNDLVDNTTLCELTRNASFNPTLDCNSMNSAGRQAGNMYGMQDYIDGQYGGRGKGFFQVVHSPEEARTVIANGQIAVVLGIEISNLFNCQVTYSPFRTETPENESGSGFPENTYNCTMQEGLPNSILTQMERIHGWGVRQVISIHEFDNAFGGNGIFDGSLLNLGNRENSGGIPSSDIAALTDLLAPTTGQAQAEAFFANLQTAETPTGEYWTTYNCPANNVTTGFSGYIWGGNGGSTQTLNLNPGNGFPDTCPPLGQGGRSGGITPCYPSNVRQCNARWMTPIGLYTYSKLMEMGFIFDFDHMEVGMKTQALELTEAQTIPYPIVSTHGDFGGITKDQARRVLKNGGFLYPSNGSSGGFRNEMNETLALWNEAFAGVPLNERPLFGFGYGTDTDGLSGQSGPRNNPPNPVDYENFVLFSGSKFSSLPEFSNVDPVRFGQPESRDTQGNLIRTWHEDMDGNAHYGMLSDFVKEIELDGNAEQLRHLYNSAEVYLRTWQQTLESSAIIRQDIQANGSITLPPGILRSAPVGSAFDTNAHYK